MKRIWNIMALRLLHCGMTECSWIKRLYPSPSTSRTQPFIQDFLFYWGMLTKPRYNIDDKFSEEALSWVLNTKNGNNKPLEITVRSSSISPAKPADWNDLGFSKISLAKHEEILARVPLFTAHTHEASTPTNQPDLQVGLEDKRTSVEVTIQASDAAVFTLGPDQSW